MSFYEILGDDVVRDLVGDAPAGGGFDTSFLVNTATDLASRAVGEYQSRQEAKETDAKVQRAVAVDNSWAGAEAALDLAQRTKDQQKIAAAQALAKIAAAESSAAGSGLPKWAADKRTAAAQRSARDAAQASFASPNDAMLAAKMRAWQKVADVVASFAVVSEGGRRESAAHAGGGEPSFFLKMHAGVPMWGWMAGGAAMLTGAALLLRRKK